MNTKLIISILILSILIAGCIEDQKQIPSDTIIPILTPTETLQSNNAELLKIEFIKDLYVKQYTQMEDVNVLDGVITTYDGRTCPETECDIRVSGNIDTSIVGEDYIKYTVVYKSDVAIVKDRKIVIESSENKNITFLWRFGCVGYCDGLEGRPGESDSRFNIINTGNTDIPKMKLIIDFYAYSGRYVNTRSTDVLFDWNMNPTETIPKNSQGYMFIKVPSQYMNEETWSYAEISLLKNNTRYPVYTWKSVNMKVSNGEQNVMPPINGNMEIEP